MSFVYVRSNPLRDMIDIILYADVKLAGVIG